MHGGCINQQKQNGARCIIANKNKFKAKCNNCNLQRSLKTAVTLGVLNNTFTAGHDQITQSLNIHT